MRRVRAWCIRLAGMFSGRRERELADELESHLQLHIDDNVRAGMSSDEARRVALLKFGPVESIKEEYRYRAVVPLLEMLLRDGQYALGCKAPAGALGARRHSAKPENACRDSRGEFGPRDPRRADSHRRISARVVWREHHPYSPRDRAERASEPAAVFPSRGGGRAAGQARTAPERGSA